MAFLPIALRLVRGGVWFSIKAVFSGRLNR